MSRAHELANRAHAVHAGEEGHLATGIFFAPHMHVHRHRLVAAGNALNFHDHLASRDPAMLVSVNLQVQGGGQHGMTNAAFGNSISPKTLNAPLYFTISATSCYIRPKMHRGQ